MRGSALGKLDAVKRESFHLQAFLQPGGGGT